MTAYSYQDWNGLSQDEQSRNPGVSITRDSALNNPNRGVYWSGQSSATALSTHIQDVLTGANREDAERMFRMLKIEHRRAVESPRAIGNAMKRRQNDAERALASSGFSLTDEQMDQLQSATDDVYRIQDQAEVRGIDPVAIADAMLNRAAAAAVGFAPPRADQMRPEFREYLTSDEGVQSQDNLNQSVRQLYAMIRHGEIDALDQVESISDYGFKEDRTQNDEREFLTSVVKTMPLERNPVPVEPNRNFSVRMDTTEEAKAMENILRWAGEQQQLPEREQVFEAFNSWRDNGLVSSPFDPRPINRVGLIVGTGNTANESAMHTLEGFAQEDFANTQILILTTTNNDIANASELHGRPVIQGRPKADENGLSIEGLAEAPSNAVVMVGLTNEQATDSITRSIAANAFVGSAYSVGHIAGNNMAPHEAQAIHLAGSMRKLSLATDQNGNQLNGKQLQELRTKAQDVDKEADANRYFAAGLARPRGGVTAVAFDGARNYDAAARRYAKGKDPMADGYSRVPKHAAILTTDDKNMASYKWLQENARDRNVLYAEATRKLSFAHDISAGIDTEKVISREAETELKIFDRPRSAREGDQSQYEVDWNDPRVRGAIVLVKGNATDSVINSAAQEKKISQEAIVDFAHTGIVFDDMQSDYHAAHITRLALEMGKRFTVIDKEGEVVPLTEAREVTRKNAQSFTEISDLNNADRFRGSLSGLSVPPEDIARAEHGRRNVAYALSDPIGQMTLAGLPGMSPEKAAGLRKLDLTLEEVYTAKDPAIKKALYENGMPSDTVKNLGDRKAWEKAVTRALLNGNAAENLDARYVGPGDSRMIPDNRAGYIHGRDHGKPIMAFFGNSQRTFDGPDGKAIDPQDLVDRKQLSDAIRAATAKGYAIGTTFEEGVSTAVLEEAAKIPEAKVVIATSGNPMASSPEMRMTLRTLLENEQAQVVMPTALAGHNYETQDGVRGTRYAELRSSMHENLAHFSDVGVVVQVSSKDQALNVADKMIAQDKPLAVMIPNDSELASTDAYRGNLKMARGAGRTEIESISLATVPSAQGYAEIVDKDTEVKLVDGVMRGNAGTFQSARFARSDMARGGHHNKTMGWGSAARPIIGEDSMNRLADDHQRGELKPLGKYVGPTVRELEERSIARNQIDSQTAEMFSANQKRFAAQIEADASRSVNY